jgi:hypothetical protein
METAEIDINAADARSHDLRMTIIICRYLLAAFVATLGCCAYRYTPEAAVERAKNKDSGYWEGHWVGYKKGWEIRWEGYKKGCAGKDD